MKLQKSFIDFLPRNSQKTLSSSGGSGTLRETSQFAIAHISHEMGSKKVWKGGRTASSATADPLKVDLDASV